MYVMLVHQHNVTFNSKYVATLIILILTWSWVQIESASLKLLTTAQYLLGESRARRIEGHCFPNKGL